MLTILLCAILVGCLAFYAERNAVFTLIGFMSGAGIGLIIAFILFAASPTEVKTEITAVYDLSAEKDGTPTFGLLLEGGTEYFVFAVKKDNEPPQKTKVPIGDVILAVQAKDNIPHLAISAHTMRPGWKLWALPPKKWTVKHLYVPANSVFKLMLAETIPAI